MTVDTSLFCTLKKIRDDFSGYSQVYIHTIHMHIQCISVLNKSHIHTTAFFEPSILQGQAFLSCMLAERYLLPSSTKSD